MISKLQTPNFKLQTPQQSFRFGICSLVFAIWSLPFGVWSFSGAQSSPTRLVAGEGRFLLDGKPLQILSGEMHYPRIPREHWRDRFRMAGHGTEHHLHLRLLEPA